MKKIILLFALASSIYSQNIYNLYKNHLPGNHLDVIDANTIEMVLLNDTHINLDLIITRIKYFEALCAMQDDLMINLRRHMSALSNESKAKKNGWLNNYLNILNEEYKYTPNFNRLVSLFEEEKSEINSTYHNYEYSERDKNYTDFFACIYLDNKSILIYDSKINYSKIRIALEKEKIDEIMENLKSIENEEEISDLLFEHWYLWEEYETNPELIISSLIRIRDKQFKDAASNNFSFFVGLSSHFFNNTSEIKVQTDFNNRQITIAEFKNFKSILLQFGYKLNFQDHLSVFSFIDLSILFSYDFSPSSSAGNEISLFKNFDIINDINYSTEFYDLNNVNIYDEFYYSLFSKTSTPVLIISNKLYVNIGIIAGLNIATNKVRGDLNYRVLRYRSDLTLPLREVLFSKIEDGKEYSSTETKFYFSGIIDLNFNINKLLHSQITAGYNFAEVKVGFIF